MTNDPDGRGDGKQLAAVRMKLGEIMVPPQAEIEVPVGKRARAWKGRACGVTSKPLTIRLFGNGNGTWNGPPHGHEAEISILEVNVLSFGMLMVT